MSPTTPKAPQQELTVRGESVESIYRMYLDNKLVVNRKYQRKLVWTLDEKKKFIDSVRKGFPVPIILLAERSDRGVYEIIDGMQRLNALMSFIENEYSVDDCYFDLNTMAASKLLLDSGEVAQHKPVMDRVICVRIASYTVPVSVYEFVEESEVDEVFRRINSGGRKLARQELRAAGSTGHFAQLVRKVAIKVRGDVSSADELLLNNMKLISISSKELPYGIDIEKIFWTNQYILTKEQVRASRDEEIIADILAYVLLDDAPSSRSEFLDDYFNLGTTDSASTRYDEIERAVLKNSEEIIYNDFLRVLDVIKLALSTANKTFGQLLFGEQPPRAPRYFQAVFLALYQLIVNENKEVGSYAALVKLLDGSGKHIVVPEGGRWGGADRQKTIDSTASLYKSAFKDADHDPAKVRWITQFENLITQSYTEQSAYDFKQGFLRLDKNKKFDDNAFEKILKTLVGMSNTSPKAKGYVVVGVADQPATAKQVKLLYDVNSLSFERIHVTGVEHEASALSKTLDELYQLVTDKVKNSKLSNDLKQYVLSHIKPIRYYDKSLIIFEAMGQTDPSSYDSKYYVRHGAQLAEIKSPEFPEFFRRYLGSSR